MYDGKNSDAGESRKVATEYSGKERSTHSRRSSRTDFNQSCDGHRNGSDCTCYTGTIMKRMNMTDHTLYPECNSTFKCLCSYQLSLSQRIEDSCIRLVAWESRPPTERDMETTRLTKWCSEYNHLPRLQGGFHILYWHQ